MSETLLIREASDADVPGLLPLLVELGYPVDENTLAERFRIFASLGESALVAARSSALIGLLTLHVTNVLHRAGPVGRITTLVVAGSEQGKGVGRALMDDAEKRLWARGCVLIEVTSNRKRTDAHVFYERLGYEKSSFRFGKTKPAA